MEQENKNSLSSEMSRLRLNEPKSNESEAGPSRDLKKDQQEESKKKGNKENDPPAHSIIIRSRVFQSQFPQTPIDVIPHPGMKSVCLQCGEKHRNRRELLLHNLVHDHIFCPLPMCSMIFNSRHDYVNHLYLHIRNESCICNNFCRINNVTQETQLTLPQLIEALNEL